MLGHATDTFLFLLNRCLKTWLLCFLCAFSIDLWCVKVCESHQYSVLSHLLLFLSPESHESIESHEYFSKRLLYYFLEFEVCYRQLQDHFLVLDCGERIGRTTQTREI